MAKNKLKVGFDLDGVIVGKPFFVPKSVLEWLYRAHDGNHKKYRIPTWKPEILIRKISHHWAFRLPLRKNLTLVKNIAQKSNTTTYIISSRYNFLKNRTKEWFNIHKLNNGLFEGIHLNLQNAQPHIFKEKMIKKLNIDIFYDDSELTLEHLSKNIKSTKFILVKKNKFYDFNGS